MNHWPYILAAYAISAFCTVAIFAGSAYFMARAERRVEKL